MHRFFWKDWYWVAVLLLLLLLLYSKWFRTYSFSNVICYCSQLMLKTINVYYFWTKSYKLRIFFIFEFILSSSHDMRILRLVFFAPFHVCVQIHTPAEEEERWCYQNALAMYDFFSLVLAGWLAGRLVATSNVRWVRFSRMHTMTWWSTYVVLNSSCAPQQLHRTALEQQQFTITNGLDFEIATEDMKNPMRKIAISSIVNS